MKEKLQAIQEATMTVQNAVGYIASFFESIKKFDFLRFINRYIFLDTAIILFQHFQLYRPVLVVSGHCSTDYRIICALCDSIAIPDLGMGNQ